LVRENNETTLHVVQGQPCKNTNVIVKTIPFASAFNANSANSFISEYPTANKTNFGIAV
jgi:hypothetical protein